MSLFRSKTAMPADAPSPLVGEGISAARSTLASVRDHSLRAFIAETTPHPASLREATLSRKGRGCTVIASAF
ncbi:hypothetical protein ABIB68_007357 [Bradyrhizobium sp. F1.2.2]